jgi:hypothetical protein
MQPVRMSSGRGGRLGVMWLLEGCSVIDPHVELLLYEFIALGSRHDYSQAAVWQGDVADFDCRLDGGRLDARPTDHYPDTASARLVLEPYLHAWELWAELAEATQFKFKFNAAKLVDRSTPGSVTAAVEMAEALVGSNHVTVTIGHAEYPQPPSEILAMSPLVTDLIHWVRDSRERQQRLLVVAYLFLTRLEFEYGGRARAAKMLNLGQRVLDKLGELSAKNDPTERRKVKRPREHLTEAERQWILTALPRITRQVAEIAAGGAPPQLNMSELPVL